MKYLKEEVDQYNIGLYICERSSDLTKCDVLKNLWKTDTDYNFPVYINKIKESSVVNGLLYFHTYVFKNYLKVNFVYVVRVFQ